MTANINYPDNITALYARLSQEDALDGESNSIADQDGICQGVFLQKLQVHKKVTIEIMTFNIKHLQGFAQEQLEFQPSLPHLRIHEVNRTHYPVPNTLLDQNNHHCSIRCYSSHR